jgi:ELWxxDGT repeat protein
MSMSIKRSSRAGNAGSDSYQSEKGPFRSPDGRSAHRRRIRRGLLGVESLETRALLSNYSASLVKDINTVDIHPSNLTPAGTNLYYTIADSANTGQELAVTTAGGGSTVLHDFLTADGVPSSLTAFGNSLYFLSGVTSNHQLWTSDGTVQGTQPVSFSDPSDPDSTGVPYLSNVAGTLYFISQNPFSDVMPGYGPDLWAVAPGATAPTLVAADITNNPDNSVSNLTAVGDVLYFTINTSGVNAVSQELWQSNGTPGQAGPVTFIDPDTQQSTDITGVTKITDFDGSLCYVKSATSESELDTYDLTTQPQTLVTFASYQRPTQFTVVGSNLFFSAPDANGGRQLWVTDGTPDGTQELTDINAGSGGINPGNLTNVNGTLYFTATGAQQQNELWMSDGTSQGTTMVMDLTTDAGYGYGYYGYYGYGRTTQRPAKLAAVGGTLFFAQGDAAHGTELWSLSDAQAPALVDDIDPGTDSSSPHDFVDFNGAVYFAAHDGTTPQKSQLWATNGGAPLAVASFTPAYTNGSAGGNTAVTIGSDLIFTANDGVNGTAVWVSDGTSGGTTLLAEANPSKFVLFTNAQHQQKAYFVATSPANGPALWETDGTVSGTSIVKSLPSQSSTYYYYNIPGNLTLAGGQLYFTSNDGNGGQDLWVSDGTAGGTTIVKDIYQSSTSNGTTYYSSPYIGSLTPVAGKLFFTAIDQSSGEDLWVSNGTSLGTSVVQNFTSSTGNSYNLITELTAANGLLFFNGKDSTHGSQLWASDGTTTQMLTDINPGATGSSPSNFTAMGNQVFFFVNESSNTVGLWQTDGTPGNTAKVTDPFPSLTVGQPPQTIFPQLANLIAINSTLYFSVSYSTVGGINAVDQSQLWTSSGLAGGTSQISPPSLGGANFNTTSNFLSLGNLLIFTADDGTHGTELWKSDGTDNGTTLIDDINQGPADGVYTGYYASDHGQVVNNGLLYFAASDGTHGNEPWVTDGTQQGTQMIADINPGISSSSPSPLADLSGRLLFFADDGVHGSELWTGSLSVGPSITPIPSQTVIVGHTLSVNVQATDTNDPTPNLVYSLVNNPPAGASINASTGALSWTPTLAQTPKVYSITVQVADTNQSGNPSNTVTFPVTVTYIPPALTAISGQIAGVGKLYQLNVASFASDPNSPPLALSYAPGTGFATGMSITPAGLLTWTPSANQGPSTQQVTVIVTDSASPSASSTASFSINVLAPPVFTPISSQIAGVGQSFQLNVATFASDINVPPLSLTYSLGNGFPSGMSITPAGLLSWVPAANQGLTTDSITVIATDSASLALSTSATFSIHVFSPPVLTAIPGQTAEQGVPFQLSVVASDPNTPPLAITYSLGLNSPAGVVINPTSGLLAWTPTSSQPPGPTSVTVVATDNAASPLSSSESFSINVIGPPVFASIPQMVATVGKTFNFAAADFVSDPNTPKLTLTYSLGANPPAGVQIDPASGLLTWAPTAAQAPATDQIMIVATDNAPTPLQSSAILSVVVSQFLPPVVTTIPVQIALEGVPFQLNVASFASDPNTPPLSLTYSLGTGAPSGVAISPAGLLTWTPTAAEAPAQASVTVVATDNAPIPLSRSKTVSFFVIGKPTLSAIPAQTAQVGQPFALKVASFASDPNSPKQALTFSLGAGAPAGAAIDSTTGALTWKPTSAQAGGASITVVVTDGAHTQLTASRTFNVDVDDAVVVVPPAPTVVLEKVILTQKTNKKGKPMGKPIFGGFSLQFSTAMNSATAGLAGNYQVLSNVVKKVKKKTTTTLKPVPFSVSFSQATNTVTLKLSSAKPFAKGGKIMISGVTSQGGTLLDSRNTVFVISANAKSITHG